nr:calcium/sodium antiporter [uncultured Haemophilus sp.]
MLLNIAYLIVGLLLLVWSADKFVDGASATARYFKLSPLLIGIVIVGFGTSTPEMLVSASSALDGASGLALGNAYGSNISNIALILGVTSMISPILVAKDVLKKELPALLAITALSAYFLTDATVTQTEAVILLVVFALYMGWRIWEARKSPDAIEEEENQEPVSLKKSVFWLVVGLLLLMASSKLMVVGAVSLAKELGVSDLVIGLTIVAVGTSLPELASSIIAARKGESDLALGNIVGSNLFNTLVVVGIAGVIRPMQVEPDIFSRDMLVMFGLTLLLALCCYPFGKEQGKITRFEGFLLLLCFVGYTLYLVKSVI